MFWGSRRRAAATVALVVAVLYGAGAVSADAQLPLPGSQEPTTTTAPPPSSSTTPSTAPATTSTTSPQLLPPTQGNGPSTTTTTTAPPANSSGPVPAAEADGGAPSAGAGPIPPELQRMIDSVRRTPANNTKKLVAALEPLGQYGLDPTQRAIVGFGRFPVAGTANWSDDWWFPRFGPGWRLHQGVDIFAAYGTPVRAPVDGTVRVVRGGMGGVAVFVTQPDRTYWYLAHLADTVAGLADGMTVKTGEVVGYVGASGNAKGSPPHVHLEIHPRGGAAIPPKPVIDRFLTDALGLVPQLLDLYARAVPQQQPVAAPVLAPEPVIETLTPREALLWASAANPAGGTLRLVEDDAKAAASRIDWDALARRAVAQDRAERRAWVYLRPLVPRALAEVIEGS